VITMADIEAIFQRHRWSYARTEDGHLATSFDGVLILLMLEPEGVVKLAAMVFQATGSERGAMQARAAAVDTFLDAVNRVELGGRFAFDRDHAAVFFSTAVRLVGGPGDDLRLGQAIAFTVSAVRAVGPVVRDLVRGRLSLTQALDILNRAVAEQERERRRRSA
jgi:hypothetical protein